MSAADPDRAGDAGGLRPWAVGCCWSPARSAWPGLARHDGGQDGASTAPRPRLRPGWVLAARWQAATPAAQHPAHRPVVGGRRRSTCHARQDHLRPGQAQRRRGGHRLGRRGGAVAGRAASSRHDRSHGGDRRLHRVGGRGRGRPLGDPGRVAGVAAHPPPGRVRGFLLGGPAGCPVGGGGPPAAVRGGHPRHLGRLGDAVTARGDLRRDPGRGALYARPRGSLAAARQVGRDRPGRGVRPGPGLPRRGRPHRRARRRRGGRRGLGRCLPAVCAQRDLPGRLPARPRRPPGRGRAPRRGDPPRPGRPARADRARGQAVRAVGVGRLDPAADPGRGRGRRRSPPPVGSRCPRSFAG